MIARLSLEVFYIITRKLVGAFYVDQKKKDLLPSTLPSEHEQWVFSAQENQNNKAPLSGFTKLSETAIHKTGATTTYATSMRDTDDNSFYIVSNAQGHSASYWAGIFK